MKIKPVLFVFTVTLAVLYPVQVLFAQDDVRSTSVAQMFLFPNDVLGVLITWLLVSLSALSMGYTLSLMLRYRRTILLPDETRKSVAQMLDERRFREAIQYVAKDASYLGRVIHAALKEAGHGFGAMERAIEEAGDSLTTKALRPVEYLNVLGNIAPMIGLFGTVYGMIRAFAQLQASGGKPDPAQLAGGISTAMITTFWGLIVAIPALASYALIRNKIDEMTSEGMLLAEEIISPFKPGPAIQQGPSQTQPPSPQPQPTNTEILPPSDPPEPQTPSP